VIEEPDSPLVADLVPSPNVEPRKEGLGPSILLLHYTGLPSVEKAIEVLSRPDCKVSCHYVVDVDGRIIQMVAERDRAWHAGVAFWAGERDINSASIGIEIQNPGHLNGYPDFPEPQMQAVRALARDIAARRAIRPERVLAHSDVAPGRKIDPGEKFDWRSLAEEGIGHWVPPAALDADDEGAGAGAHGPTVLEARALLAGYGYRLQPHGSVDDDMQSVVRAFQLHFRPMRADGRLDRSTLDTLSRLVASLSSPDPISAGFPRRSRPRPA
jgi:N-acetylmuramoyl-L-alanine amidase